MDWLETINTQQQRVDYAESHAVKMHLMFQEALKAEQQTKNGIPIAAYYKNLSRVSDSMAVAIETMLSERRVMNCFKAAAEQRALDSLKAATEQQQEE